MLKRKGPWQEKIGDKANTRKGRGEGSSWLEEGRKECGRKEEGRSREEGRKEGGKKEEVKRE